MYQWRVKRSEHGLSLENYIYKQLGDWSHKQVKDAINHKRAFVNSRNVFISKWNVKTNDRVIFSPVEKDQPGGTTQAWRYRFVDVLFEDTHLIVVNKPAFVDYETYMGTIKNYLSRKNHGKGHPYVGAMHRLDKETSGIMVFTKKKIANTLADQFRDHSIQKFYAAIVLGQVKKEEGVIKKALEKGEFEEGKKSRIAEDQSQGKQAITRYRVIERYANATLIRVQILTGRTHQIRVHFSAEGHPLVGDKLYDGEVPIPITQNSPITKFRRQALHAERLDFVHPITKKKMSVLAPLPLDMRKLVDELRERV